MSIFVCIVGLVLMLCLTRNHFKDLLYPGFLVIVPWLFFLVLLLFGDLDVNKESLAYLYFFLGIFLFEVGCVLGSKGTKQLERLNDSTEIYKINYQSLNVFVFIELLFSMYVIARYYSFIRSHWHINIFISYYTNRQDFAGAAQIGYLRNLFTSLGVCLVVSYPHVPLEDKRKYRAYILFQMVIFIILAITRVTRNGILFALIPFFVSLIIVTNQTNKQIRKYIILAIIGFFLLFSAVSVMKYYYLFKTGEYWNTIKNQFALYGTGGIVAFQKQFDMRSFPNMGGANTFRFVLSIVDTLFHTSFTPKLEQEFIGIGNGYVTNVFTFFHWYVSDFGLLYGLFVEFVIGYAHGLSYRKMSRMDMFGIYLYSILMYPLLMQGFEDQYFSLTSNWLQMVIYGIIFLKTNIIVRRADGNKLVLYL